MKTKVILTVLIIMFLISCKQAAKEIKKNDKTFVTNFNIAGVLKNEPYGPEAEQVFDLYLPKNRSSLKTKTFVLIHGGSWIKGDKSEFESYIPIFQKKFPDYAIANINYRLADGTKYAFPDQNEDVKTALDKLINNNYGISDDFGMIGVSAGAHLCLLHSYSMNKNNNIKMVISLIGITNLTDANYKKQTHWVNFFKLITGIDYLSNTAYFENLSPYHIVTSDAPPTLLLYGNQDNIIPNSQHEDLHKKLDELLVYNEIMVYNGGHGNWSKEDKKDSHKRIIDFIKRKF